MRDLIKILVVGGFFSLYAGAALAKPVELSCSTEHCDYTGELGPSQTKVYHGHCDGTGNTEVTHKNSHMSCQFTNCTPTTGHKYKKDFYWACTCTDYSPKNEVRFPITIDCPPRS